MKNKAQKKLIVNADDYGLDQAACDAILYLSEKMLISSTSVMANMVTDAQLEKIVLQKNISTGWHINIIEGKPLSHPEEISSIVNQNGEFLSSKALLLKAMSGRLKKDHISIEMKTQYNKLLNAGINISHADAHQHTHQLPIIGPEILKILHRLGIRRIRFGKISDNNSRRMRLLRIFHRMNKRSSKGFNSPEILITTLSTGNIDFLNLENSIKNAFLEANCVEIMTHPATNNSKTYLDRMGEYELWRSEQWSNYLKSEEVELIPYSILPILNF